MTPDAGATQAEAVWGDVLRDYRSSLDDQRSMIERVQADGDLDNLESPTVFAPPIGLPPLPDALHAEAAALDAETAELLAAARALLAQLKPPNSAPMHRSILAPPSPSQMDTRL
jgi:hypothetical protein